MIAIEERDDVSPVCPFCATVIQRILYQTLTGMFGKRYVYFCSECKKVLGVSHRKGFWMG